MSEQDLKQDQEVAEDQAQLDEFKASMGDPSEVPEPTSTTAAAPGPSKDQGDKEAPKQGSSEKPKMPPEVKGKLTKMGMINAMVKMMGKQNKDKIKGGEAGAADKLSGLLIKVQTQGAMADVQKAGIKKKELEIKSKVDTAKEKEKAQKDLEKKDKEE